MRDTADAAERLPGEVGFTAPWCGPHPDAMARGCVGWRPVLVSSRVIRTPAIQAAPRNLRRNHFTHAMLRCEASGCYAPGRVVEHATLKKDAVAAPVFVGAASLAGSGVCAAVGGTAVQSWAGATPPFGRLCRPTLAAPRRGRSRPIDRVNGASVRTDRPRGVHGSVNRPFPAIRASIAESLDLVLHIERRHGLRVVSELVAVEGYDHTAAREVLTTRYRHPGGHENDAHAE